VFPGVDQYFGKPAFIRVPVPAEQVLHIYRPIRAGQLRGIPHTLSMITTLALLDIYDDAELERKRTAALFAAFITRPDRTAEDHLLGDADEVTTPLGDMQTQPQLEPGVTVDLAPGEDIKFSNPVDVGSSFEPFQYRCLLRASAGAGIPYSDMTGDLRRTSFGSIRAGLIAHRRKIETLQQSIIVYQLCQRVWRRWWTEAVLAAALPVSATDFAKNQRTYWKAEFVPPKWDWIDPLKDLEPEQLAVENHFKARSDVIKAMGGDPTVVDNQIKRDMDRENGKLAGEMKELRAEVAALRRESVAPPGQNSGRSQRRGSAWDDQGRRCDIGRTPRRLRALDRRLARHLPRRAAVASRP
jgi:lambda family phage portal protein